MVINQGCVRGVKGCEITKVFEIISKKLSADISLAEGNVQEYTQNRVNKNQFHHRATSESHCCFKKNNNKILHVQFAEEHVNMSKTIYLLACLC